MRLSSFLSFSVLNAANLPGHDIKKIDLTNSQLADIKEKYCFRQAQTGGRDSVCEKDDEIPDWIWEIHFASVQYCKDFYRDFHGVEDPRKTSNRFLAAGGQGMVSVCGSGRTDSSVRYTAYSHIQVYECRTSEENVEPEVVASKLYYTTDDKNLTEINLINTAISDAGVRATLYWFHDRGYVEEFLGHKKGNRFEYDTNKS